MDTDLFERWRADGLISEASLERVKLAEKNRLFSLFFELKTLLYLGVSLLSTGLGILVYKNIDSIGHQVIVAFIALVSAGCIFWCNRKKAPFSKAKAASPDLGFDYILLLGNVSFLTLVGYLQFQYNLFGNAYGLALFVPMIFLFANAYYFDHLGILSLAITNLGAWAGIALTPLRLLRENPFADPRLMYTGLSLGVLLIVAGYASRKRGFKAHFSFTYHNFAFHLLFIAALTGLFVYESWYLAWFAITAAIGIYFFLYATRSRSIYFLVFTFLYSYVAVTYVLGRLLFSLGSIDVLILYLPFLYFIGTIIAFVRLLKYYNAKMKQNDRL